MANAQLCLMIEDFLVSLKFARQLQGWNSYSLHTDFDFGLSICSNKLIDCLSGFPGYRPWILNEKIVDEESGP
jgi:hypothetical protein